MRVQELIEWLEGQGQDNTVAIGDGGLTLEIYDQGSNPIAYYEVGGYSPEEGEA